MKWRVPSPRPKSSGHQTQMIHHSKNLTERN